MATDTMIVRVPAEIQIFGTIYSGSDGEKTLYRWAAYVHGHAVYPHCTRNHTSEAGARREARAAVRAYSKRVCADAS